MKLLANKIISFYCKFFTIAVAIPSKNPYFRKYDSDKAVLLSCFFLFLQRH